jgi:hypothetical protein
MTKDQAGAGLGDYGDVSDVGNVDMFGLDEYGEIPAGALSPLWGAAIGGGVSTAASIATRALWKSPAGQKWSEGIGFAAGVLAGGAMYFFPKSKHAGIAAILTSFVTSGLRQVETLVMAPKAAGFGNVVIDKQYLVPGSGFGEVTIQQQGAWNPQGGLGAQPGAFLVGAGGANLVGADQAQLVGPSGLSHGQLANHYGASITG